MIGRVRQLRPWARPLATTAFGLAAFCYFLPFATGTSFNRGSFAILGVALALWGLIVALPSLSVAGLEGFVTFALPLLATIGGLVVSLRLGWRSAVARVAFAGTGFAGLALGNLWQTGLDWAAGYYLAASALLVAGAASALRLWAVLRLGQESAPEVGPALSASQELFRKHDRW